jgi:BirA family biotin operon repressor/biotin-[acetyl-CoA-carboxylase] ligase
MPSRSQILKILSDGEFHSGTDIGRRLHVTRAAISKAVKALSADGVEIHRVTGRGYRLAAPLQPLERTRILRALDDLGFKWPGKIEVLEEVDSTNLELLRQTQAGAADERVCVAEAQSGGRGRRGRGWVATPYRNIIFSIAWRFDAGSARIGGLSLAAGVAVLRALRAQNIEGVALKWPNDIVWNGRKLAGLLIDVRGEAAGPLLAVVGLGLNVQLDARARARIDQPCVDLSEISGQTPDRNWLVAQLIREVAVALREFERAGFAAFRDEWQRHHYFTGKRVGLARADAPTLYGTVTGVDDQGALLLRDARGKVQAFHSGEISVRLAV